MDDAETIRTARFWDRIAAWYARQPIADEAAYARKLEVTRGYLRPDMEVLEIGCGTGGTAIAHAPHVKHIRAIDISTKMIAIAMAKAATAQADNVDFEQATIDELNVADGSLDAVLALSILHLLDNRDAVIDQIFRMLKPDGLFVSSTTCVGDRMPYFGLIVPIGKLLRLMPHVSVFTGADLKQAVTGAEFEIHHEWQPDSRHALFLVAIKPGSTSITS